MNSSKKSAKSTESDPSDATPNTAPVPEPANGEADNADEFGGPKGPEPTRYGDWEKAGRCIDF